MVYVIALPHAFPAVFASQFSTIRSRPTNTAIFMACLGMLTGNPAYIAIRYQHVWEQSVRVQLSGGLTQ